MLPNLEFLSTAVKGAKITGNTIGTAGFALTAYNVGAKVVEGTANTSDFLDLTVSGGLLTTGLLMANPVGLSIIAFLGVGYGIYRIGWGEESDNWINDQYGFR